MPITTTTFARWFEPGPKVRSSQQTQSNLRWPIKTGTKTTLMPAIPSALKAPSPAEWKNSLTSLEWEVVGATWITLGRTILERDPWFGFVKHPSYITDAGKFTPRFRQKPWHDQYVTQLALRMDEEIAFYGDFIRVLQKHATRPSGLAIQTGAADSPENENAFETAAWGWAFRNWGQSAVYCWKASSLFSPAGLGWAVLFEAAKYGQHKYQQHQRAQERARKQKAQGILEDFRSSDPEVAEFMANSPTDVEITGWLPSQTFYIGCWAVRPEGAKDYNPFTEPGAPKYLTANDGIYSWP